MRLLNVWLLDDRSVIHFVLNNFRRLSYLLFSIIKGFYKIFLSNWRKLQVENCYHSRGKKNFHLYHSATVLLVVIEKVILTFGGDVLDLMSVYIDNDGLTATKITENFPPITFLNHENSLCVYTTLTLPTCDNSACLCCVCVLFNLQM